MKRLKLDPVQFLENFVRAFHKDARLMFKVENTRIKNKFCLMLEINKEKYKIYAAMNTYNRVIYVSIDPIFKKAHPDLMLRNGIYVSLDDLEDKYGIRKADVAKACVSKIKNEFEYGNWRSSFSNTFVATSVNTYIKLRYAKTFEEFVVNLDLYAS